MANHQIDFNHASILAQEQNDDKCCSLESWYIQKQDTLVLTGIQEVYLQSTVALILINFLYSILLIYFTSLSFP